MRKFKDKAFIVVIAIVLLVLIAFACQVLISVHLGNRVYAISLPMSEDETQEDYYYLLPTVWEAETTEATEIKGYELSNKTEK